MTVAGGVAVIRQLLLALSMLGMAVVARAENADALFAATLEQLDDKPVALAAWKGKPLVVNFWARWCAPCRTEIPGLSRLQAAYKGAGLVVLGIAIEDQAEPVRAFAKANAMDYTVLLAGDRGMALMQALGNGRSALPFTVYVNRKGEIVGRKLGALKPADLAAAAAAALK